MEYVFTRLVLYLQRVPDVGPSSTASIIHCCDAVNVNTLTLCASAKLCTMMMLEDARKHLESTNLMKADDIRQ